MSEPVAPARSAKPRWRLTDVGNAQRFAFQHQAWAKYCYALRTWFLWNGKYWHRDPGDGVMRLAKATAVNIFQEIAGTASTQEREQLAKWATTSESERRLHAMIELAQSEPGMAVLPEDFDADPLLLNCESGTLDLRPPGALRPHRREDMLSKMIPVTYDPAATCPTFDEFLKRIFAGRRQLIEYVQRAIGYSLTGLTIEQVLLLCYGIGANGKTVLMKTIAALLAGYSATLAADTLLARKGDAGLVLNDLATLQGARFVVAVESDMGRRMAEALVKQLTGGDPIKVKKLYADVFSIMPTFKLWIGTNHRPVIRGSDHAMWRRIHLIPFDVVIADQDQDHQLLDKLRAELPGVLAWAVRGCLAWQQGGLRRPDEVQKATAQYRRDMDIVSTFLADRCVLSTIEKVAVSELYKDYTAWAEQEGEPVLSKPTLHEHLIEKGLIPARLKSQRIWRGLRLRTPMDPEADPAGDAVTPGDADSGNLPRVRALGEVSRNGVTHVTTSPDDTSDCYDPAPREKGLPW